MSHYKDDEVKSMFLSLLTPTSSSTPAVIKNGGSCNLDVHGDYQLIFKTWSNDFVYNMALNLQRNELVKAVETEAQKCILKVKVWIRREILMKSIIGDCMRTCSNKSTPLSDRLVLVYHWSSDMVRSLADLRGHLISQVITRGVVRKGYRACNIGKQTVLTDLIQPSANVECDKILPRTGAEFEATKCEILSAAASCSYCVKKGDDFQVDVESYAGGLEDACVRIGVESVDLSVYLEELAHVHMLLRGVEEPCMLIHVVPHVKQFRVKVTSMLHSMLCSTKTPVTHCFVVYEGVRPTGEVQEYVEAVKREMINVSRLKYGECVLSERWKSNITAITSSHITFRLLGTSCEKKIVTSCESDKQQPGNVKGGTFVLYNYARISTLLANYREKVDGGLYPPLPPLEEINFSLLTDTDEWKLIFNHLFPSSNILPSPDTIENYHVLTFPIHKVCISLCGLTSLLSRYYSRVHILGEAKPHLYGLMFARISLLTAIQRHMREQLELLGVTPLTQM